MSLTLTKQRLTLISADIHLTRQLSYLFRVVLGGDLVTVKEYPTAAGTEDDIDSADLLVFHASGPADTDYKRIVELKSRNPHQLIIVIRGEGALPAAQAFAAGAADAVTTPLNLSEFTSRVAVRLGDTRVLGFAADENVTWEAEAFISDRAELTTAEAHVMRVLYSQAGQTVTRDKLSHAIYGRPWEYGDRKFDVHVAKLRKKLSDAFGKGISVSTIRSSGYLLTIHDLASRKDR